MNSPINERTYRNAFYVSLIICILLGGMLVYKVLPRTHAPAATEASDPVVAQGPPATSPSQPAAPASTPGLSEPNLAPLQISPQRLQEIGVTTGVAQIKNISENLQAPGNVNIDEERLSYVQTRFPGWIQNVFANATWQYVHKGQRLFTIYSPELVSTEQEYLLAKQNQKAFSTGMQGMAGQESGWLLRAAEERLRQFDVPSAEVAALEQSGKVQREIAVESPASGYITERNALPNAYVQPDTKLYTIADLSTVWVYANVFQTDIGKLKPNDPAQVTVDSYPGRTFRGHIDQILPDVDPNTRTARVRLVFSNPGLVLKPGMYVNVNIATPLGRQLVIPASAVLQGGNRQIAFVDHGQGNLEPREIETGPQIDDSVVVLKGLKDGDRVVSSANFLLDSEAQLQSALNSFAPLPQQSGASSTAAPQTMQIAFITDPSPARKGANTMQVRLTGADGKPVTGANVTATFFMSPMPGMGMPAMHSEAKLADKGQGAYAGAIQLGSGGTWQVTIAVSLNGQPVASRQMSVNATGGM